VLPRAHAGELERKPPFHQAWSRGFRGSELEWANPGWALFSELERLTILAAYYGMISQIDHAVGRILAALESRGQARETLVVFTADHGDYMGDHQMILKGPIHYEALLRVPLLVRGPGFAPGAVVDDPVGTIDLAPSVLSASGLALPAALEGRPIRGEPREHVLTEDDMIRGVLAFRTLTTRRWRLTRNERDPAGGELYDLADDPGELVNRWSDPALAATRSDLLATLDDVMRHDLGRVLPLVCQAG
jgi:arylsulfatase A-like enzyme